jgi:hypothetical protein
MSDISKNFVWRSLYSRQVRHCFASLPSDRWLVLHSSELRNQPQQTLKRVFAHAGLQDESVELAKASDEQLSNEFKRHFPDFEAVSGWTHEGVEEEPIPEALRAFLVEFFRPFNRELFDILKVEPFEGWEV